MQSVCAVYKEPMIVHIMNEEKRLFYELEKLWYMGEVIYSSKSSMSNPSSYS